MLAALQNRGKIGRPGVDRRDSTEIRSESFAPSPTRCLRRCGVSGNGDSSIFC
ncbi:MAG: hypothetical protein SGARI_002355, partial [Bacillariaceae sp.]